MEGLSGPVLACDAMTSRYIDKARGVRNGERKYIPRPGGGAMPGAPPTPGKPLKEGGGPYGFPPVVGPGQLLVATAKGPGGKGWMRAHLRMDCRPCCVVDVPLLLICHPRLLSRTDNIRPHGNPAIKVYDAAKSRLRLG